VRTGGKGRLEIWRAAPQVAQAAQVAEMAEVGQVGQVAQAGDGPLEAAIPDR
jgi:hypothetical protein